LKSESNGKNFEYVNLLLLTPDSHILKQLVFSGEDSMVAEMINQLSRSKLVDYIELNASRKRLPLKVKNFV